MNYRVTLHQIVSWYQEHGPATVAGLRVYRLWRGVLDRAARNAQAGESCHRTIPAWEVDIEHLGLPPKVVEKMQSYPRRAD